MDFIDTQLNQLKEEKKQMENETKLEKDAFAKDFTSKVDIKTDLGEAKNYFYDALMRMDKDRIEGQIEMVEQKKKRRIKDFFIKLINLL